MNVSGRRSSGMGERAAAMHRRTVILVSVLAGCAGGAGPREGLSTDRRLYRRDEVARVELRGVPAAPLETCKVKLQRRRGRWEDVLRLVSCPDGPVPIGPGSDRATLGWRLAGLLPGRYRFVYPLSDARPLATEEFEVVGAGSRMIAGHEFRIGREDGPVEGGAALRGRVFDIETGLPLRDVVIGAGDRSATVDCEGRFSLSVEPGSYYLLAYAVTNDVYRSASVSVEAGSTTVVSWGFPPAVRWKYVLPPCAAGRQPGR